uniref:Uncharacterized protein n=1 Tax=Rhizophora mucronata TaxID=61149 RepID=A0A2P2JYA2_RHIMU
MVFDTEVHLSVDLSDKLHQHVLLELQHQPNVSIRFSCLTFISFLLHELNYSSGLPNLLNGCLSIRGPFLVIHLCFLFRKFASWKCYQAKIRVCPRLHAVNLVHRDCDLSFREFCFSSFFLLFVVFCFNFFWTG